MAKKEKTKLLENTGNNPDCCEMCGSSYFVSDHHIIKRSEDGYKYNAAVDNLVRVCQKCHEKFHAYDYSYLITTNSEVFTRCLKWLHTNGKFVTLSKFMKDKC